MIEIETQINYLQKKLKVFLFESCGTKKFVFLLSGGDTVLGKKRYNNWQKELASLSINSISFDYSGVDGSGVVLSESSLQGRIQEAECVARWLIRRHPGSQIYLFGSSMGGYISLGLVETMPDIFKKLVLFAPAAYSKYAHNLNFGKKFKHCISKNRSWKDSLSYCWIKNYDKEILLVEAENDLIIPKEIIETYKKNIQNHPLSAVFLLQGSPHNIWSEREEDKKFKKIVFDCLISFFDIRPLQKLGTTQNSDFSLVSL